MRFGLLPRHEPEAQVRWFSFDVPTDGFTVFHTMAAWEDAATDSVVLVACRQV